MICQPALALPQKENYDQLVHTNALDFRIGAKLLQLHGGNMAEDRIIAYRSRKLPDAEMRYSTYDKELLGNQHAIEHWWFYFKCGHHFRAQTDHSSLQHIVGQPKLTGRQMRLLETLQEYDFDIEYYPDTKHYIQDTLSCRTDY
jgi:hypothetical protein